MLKGKQTAGVVFAVLGSIGVVATAVVSAMSASKALTLLEKAKAEKEEDLTTLEKAKAMAPAYIYSAIFGVGTIACIAGSSILDKKKQASIIGAYALVDQAYGRYKKAVKSTYGEDADDIVKTKMAEESDSKIENPVYNGSGLYSKELHSEEKELLFYDDFSNRYFTTTIGTVLNAQYHVNRYLALQERVPVNEYYEMLGIDDISGGDRVGWEMSNLIDEGLYWLDFVNVQSEMDDGLICYIASAPYPPMIFE